MKLEINIYASLFCLLSLGTLSAQQGDSTLMYLSPFQNTQLIDDYLLLTDNLGLTLDRVSLLDAPDGISLKTETLQTPAYFKFDESLYLISHENNLQEISPLTTDGQIHFRPIHTGSINYEGYYLSLPLDDTEHLGIRLLNYGYLEKLRINK